MRDHLVGRACRAIRFRRGWRQQDVAAKAGLSRSGYARVERGDFNEVTLTTLRRYAAALDITMELLPRHRGAELARLLDADHAALQEWFKRRLEALGWVAAAEVSFNRFGDRGRFDLIGFHPGLRIALAVEIKTVIADLQDLLGTLDVKVRVTKHVTSGLGWPPPTSVLPVLLVADTASARRRINEHTSLFAPFPARGRSALAWLRRPHASAIPNGLLVFATLPNDRRGDRRRAGRQRVRLARQAPRSRDASGSRPRAARPS